jgi:hypothetical protein
MERRSTWVLALATMLGCAGSAGWAFQLAPMGSQFEAKLTNETPNWLAKVAGKVGVLLKEPVHEEITQLAFGCPVSPSDLQTDQSCLGGDHGFANHFVIYGVRWNDLPPFRLNNNEGRGCKKILLPLAAACNTSQTVRFATQPDCWYCLFQEAQRSAEKRKIAGCQKGKGIRRGNLMTRSHFGDLQFLHAMANEDGVPPNETRKKVLEWLEFAWKVATREIRPQTRLNAVGIPTIAEHFGCTEWTVADIYILGRNDRLLPRVHEIALGSVLHTVQDSFAGGHTTRESVAPPEICPGTTIAKPPRVVEFHSYIGQDAHKHDARDTRQAMVEALPSQWPLAVEATRQLFELFENRTGWADAKPYLECVFDLAPDARNSSGGDLLRALAR